MAKTKSTKKPISHAPVSRRHRIVTEALGWYGAAAILSAYALTSFSILDVHNPTYLLLNLSGALGVLTVATAKHVRQSMVVNAFWAAMAAIALLKIVLQV